VNRRDAVLALLALGVAPLTLLAQQQGKFWRIGFLWTSVPEPAYIEAFRSSLRDLSYIEGKNIAIEQRSAGNLPSRLIGQAEELVRLNVDVLVTQGSPAAQAVSKATKEIPVVVALGDPLGAGLVSSLGRPGGNVTGLTLLASELNPKRLELIKQIDSKIIRIALLVDSSNNGPAGMPLVDVPQVKAAANSLGLSLQTIEVSGRGDFSKAFGSALQSKAQALVVSPSPILSFYNKLLVDLAAKNRLPSIYGNPESVLLGGLMSYGPSYSDLCRRAAFYVDKIFKGLKPADLPIEQPTKFEFVVNSKTARTLGIRIPQSVLLRADRIVE
jgi:putative tryptophan/tyrosine transport system substrate-binding protein